MAAPEILVTAGVAALLAAAVGTGLKAFGIEVQALGTIQRQVVVALTGAVLLGLGIWLGRPTAPPPPPPPPHPMMALAIAPAIDFRSSEKNDSLAAGSGKGYLLVTTALELRSRTGRRISWNVTGASLQIGGAKIPFRPYYFTSLNNEVEPWLGPNPKAAGPGTLNPDEPLTQEIMFIPEDAGGGLYKWDAFLRELFVNGQTNPVFTVTVAPSIGETVGSPVSKRCVAQVDDLMEDLLPLVGRKSPSHWITAGCSD